jgi:hypothetical protein
MYEEWFEIIAREKGIERVIQNRNSIELIFNSESSSRINVNDLFIKAYDISKMFRFGFVSNKLKIILDVVKIEKHWLYYCLNLLNEL